MSLLSPDLHGHPLGTHSGGQLGLFLGKGGTDVCFFNGLQPNPYPGVGEQPRPGVWWVPTGIK